MKVLFAYGAGEDIAAGLKPYRSDAFRRAMGEKGAELLAMETASGDDDRSRRRDWAEAVRAFQPEIAHTFGGVAALGPIWQLAQSLSVPVVHGVLSSRSADGGKRAGFWRAGPNAFFNGRRLCRASRSVSALVATNGAAAADMLTRGLFPSARLSVIAPPPVAIPPRIASPALRPEWERGAAPVFGYFDPNGSRESLEFVLDAAAMFGAAPCSLRIPAMLARRHGLPLRGVEPVEAEDCHAFVRSINALVVAQADDAIAEPLIAALAAGRRVIAPDQGVTAELLDFGRRGDLFESGSRAQLALAMQNVASAWGQQPIYFDASDLFAVAEPAAVAGRFVDLYRQMLGQKPTREGPT